MRTSLQRVLVPVVAAVLAATLTSASDTARADDQHPGDPGPIGPDGQALHASKEFRWGLSTWEDEFRQKKLRPTWKVNKAGTTSLKVGALTMKAGVHSGTVTATNAAHPASYGRWESRVHASQSRKVTGNTPYLFVWELVPVGAYKCGARNIVLAAYHQDDEAVTGSVRTAPDNVFAFRKPLSQLGFGDFHTYAIEVTRKHISWFVDGSVIATERRKAALSGVKYKVRFRMQDTEGEAMNPSTLQMDWVRYYTLERKNAKPIKAPAMDLRKAASTTC